MDGLRFRWPRPGEGVTQWVRAGAGAATRVARVAILRRAQRWRYRHGADPIIIFQAGKVGSRSVFGALKRLQLPHPVHHVHHLMKLDELERVLRSSRASPAASLGQITRDRQVLREIERNPGIRWNVVSLVRDPVARNISLFFQEMDEYHPGIQAQHAARTHRLDTIRDAFFNRHAKYGSDGWFDEQLKPVFGVDVFAAPFPTDRGYLTIRQPRATLLLIRLENLDQCAHDAFREAFGIRNVRPERENTAADKWYRDLYREFLDGLVLPASYLDAMYESRFARHFYTPDELVRFRTRWTLAR